MLVFPPLLPSILNYRTAPQTIRTRFSFHMYRLYTQRMIETYWIRSFFPNQASTRFLSFPEGKKIKKKKRACIPVDSSEIRIFRIRVIIYLLAEQLTFCRPRSAADRKKGKEIAAHKHRVHTASVRRERKRAGRAVARFLRGTGVARSRFYCTPRG